MMTYAAADFMSGIAQSDVNLLLSAENNLYLRVLHGFTIKELRDFTSDCPSSPPDLYYESVGVFAVRDEHYHLSVKAGRNADSHNHNDTGSFTIYKNGRPLFIDIGVETYTRKTFSPERYEIWTMQSAYHNLPTIRGVQQKDGNEYAASDVSCKLNGHSPFISMNIAGAYPLEAFISSYTRLAKLKKGNGITIEDSFDAPPYEVVLSLMTYEIPTVSKTDPSLVNIGDLGSLQIEGCTIELTEEIPITDKRLQNTWEHNVYRILLRGTQQTIKLTII